MQVEALLGRRALLQHTSAYVSICEHMPAYVSIRVPRSVLKEEALLGRQAQPLAYVSIRQHTSAYVSIRQQTHLQ